MDVVSNAVFKITPDGQVQIVAGSGEVGYADGVGRQAKFTYPHSLALDAKGNLYVGDYDGHRVRKITPDGQVTTLAGSGEEGYAEGVGRRAKLERPVALAVDAHGNVYVAHDRNNVISKITPDGVVSTVATIREPSAIAVDRQGNIYVATGDYRIVKITQDRRVTTIAGSGEKGYRDGRGTEARLVYPCGLAVDTRNNLYFTDTGTNNHRVRKITPDGQVTTFAGSGERGSADGEGSRATFDYPGGIAVDNSGYVYVLDSWDRPGWPQGMPKLRVRKISPDGNVTTLVGKRESGR